MNDIKQNDLVTINENRQPVTTSVKIAEVFGREHKNVIRAINNIIGDLRNLEDSGRHNFAPSSACDSNRLNFELVNDVNFYLDSYIDVKGEKRKEKRESNTSLPATVLLCWQWDLPGKRH